MGTPNRGSEVSGVLAIGSSLGPTPLPATNDAELPLSWWGSELGACGEADLQACWVGEDEANFLAGPSDAQAESPAPPSSNGSGSQKAEHRRQRKKEEGGWCELCNRWFSRRSDVRRHKNTAHAKEVHACPRCQIICSRRDALHRHIRDQH